MLLHLLYFSIGLEYVDTIFQTIQDSSFSQYTLTGMKTLAVLFFMINILKKYNEGIVRQDGYTWGLSPSELSKNFAIVLLVIFSTQILGFLDGILVAIENQYRSTAPELIPLIAQDFPIEEDTGIINIMSKAMALLYEALITPMYALKALAFIGGILLWILDLFIYPLFLAERFFLLGILQAFFPLIISLAVFEKFRSLAYSFFKLYAAVYMLVPAFFLVNVFINAIYHELTTNFWENLLGTNYGSDLFAPLIQFGTICFIFFLKFKLYKRATSFTLRLFTS